MKTMFSAQARKAYVAAILAGLSAAVVAAQDGLTLPEYLTIAVAVVAAFQATYWTSNADAPEDGAHIENVWQDKRV